MAITKHETIVGDPLKIELLPLLRAMQLCSSLGIHSLVMESDSMLAIKALIEGEESITYRNHLL